MPRQAMIVILLVLGLVAHAGVAEQYTVHHSSYSRRSLVARHLAETADSQDSPEASPTAPAGTEAPPSPTSLAAAPEAPAPLPPSPVSAVALPSPQPEKVYPPPVFNSVMAFQQIGPLYSFARPGESPLLEAARIAINMGMPSFKFTLDVSKYFNATRHIPGVDFTSKSLRLRDIVSKHPDVVQILNMPFKYFVMWAYTPGMDNSGKALDKYVNDTGALQLVYSDFYNLTDYLLRKFSGTGKTFMLGNWEGDWALVLAKEKGKFKNPDTANGMIKWMQTRQNAVDAAKSALKPKGVEVYNYMELNHVMASLNDTDFQCAANFVLPFVTNLDFVSLSSYDVMGSPLRGQNNSNLIAALTLLDSRIPPKNLTNYLDPKGVAPPPFVRRAFVGEYGYKAGPGGAMSSDEAGRRAAQLAKDVITWGAPFCLYWQLYNNDPDAAVKNSGWYLIDPNNTRLASYTLHQTFTAKAQSWARTFMSDNGRLPTPQEFASTAASLF